MTRRIIAAALTVAGLLLTGCTSASPIPQGAASAGTGSGGTGQGQHATAQPVGPPGAQPGGTLRLGLQEDLADAAALAGWQLGFYGQHLGKVTLQPLPSPSSAAETAALENGQLDAAYLDPLTALQAIQARPGTLKIIAGAAAGGPALIPAPAGPARHATRLSLPAGQFPAAVLVVTQRYLTANPAAVTSLLRGQFETDYFLTHDRISAKAALAQRLTAIGTPIAPAALARSFTQYAYTENPLPAAFLTEAQHAATAGLINPVKNPAAIYDLTLLNQELKAAGQPAIGL